MPNENREWWEDRFDELFPSEEARPYKVFVSFLTAEAERRKEIEIWEEVKKLICEVHDATSEKYASGLEMCDLRDEFIQSINSRIQQYGKEE